MREPKRYKAYVRSLSGELVEAHVTTAIDIHHHLYNQKSEMKHQCELNGLVMPILAVVDGGKQ